VPLTASTATVAANAASARNAMNATTPTTLLTAPRLLVQLSDTHIMLPGERIAGRVDTAPMLARAVQAVVRLRQAPHAVLLTGDLVEGGRAGEYARLRDLLAPLPCRYYLMPGNHDDRSALREAFADHAYLQQRVDEDYIQYEVDLGGLRLLTLDTVVPMQSHGALCARRLAWLDDALAQGPTQPTVVAMHHPPFRTFLHFMDGIGLLEGADALAQVLLRHPQVERVICGHLHRPIQARIAHTVALTAPSTAHQIDLNLEPGTPPRYTLEPPGFMVHAWQQGGPLVSHTVPVGDFEGPCDYE
jgi:Icc protein